MINKKNKNPSKQPIIEEMANSIKRDAILKKDLQLLYMFSMDVIEKEIQAFIARYEKKGINVSELKKRVTVDEIAVLKRRIEQYLQQKKKTTGGTLQLDQFNALNTLSRLELLQYQIDLAMLELTDGEHRIADKFLQQEFLKGLEVNAQSIGANVMSANQLAISMNTIIHEDFKGQKWSSNIWKNKEALRNEVSIVVANSLLRGKNPIIAVNKIRELFKTSEYEARRLLITEGTRVNANAQVAMMKANGYDYCEIVPESNACGICKPLANRPIKIDDAVSGENIPPFHPHCKCGLVASVGEDVEKQKSEVYNNYVVATSEIEERLQNNSDKVFKKMLYSEKNAFDEYTGDFYAITNKYLRNDFDEYDYEYNFEERLKNAKIRVKELDRALNSSTLGYDLKLFRYTDEHEFYALNKTDTFKNYLSTSISETATDHFGDYKIVINATTETKGIYLGQNSQSRNEKEFLVQRNAKYKIISFDEDKQIMEIEIYVE